MENTHIFKILIAGQGGVGKTTLIKRVISGKFVEDTGMTIGVDFKVLNLKFENGISVILQLWDFGGQERFRFMLDAYTKGAHGAILLYDLTRIQSLDNLEEWVNIVRDKNPEVPILFVGSKADMVADISVEDEYAKEHMEPLKLFGHLKASSKNGEGVKAIFETIARELLKRKKIL
jgi:small GTP-binding protein